MQHPSSDRFHGAGFAQPTQVLTIRVNSLPPDRGTSNPRA